jgi:hypothetical protein
MLLEDKWNLCGPAARMQCIWQRSCTGFLNPSPGSAKEGIFVGLLGLKHKPFIA